MTPQTAAPTRATPASRGRGLLSVPAVAGLAYTVSWLAGLAVAPSSTDVRSAGAQVVAGYAGHRGPRPRSSCSPREPRRWPWPWPLWRSPWGGPACARAPARRPG